MSNVGEDLYSGAAGFGKIEAVIGVVIGTIIGIILIPVGITLIIAKDKHTKSVDGTVTKVTCNADPVVQNSAATYNCSVTATYTVNSTLYTKPFQIDSNKQYIVNDIIKLKYNPADPNDSETDQSPVALGWILLCAGLFIMLTSWLWLWITKKSKFAAAAGGASGLMNMFRR